MANSDYRDSGILFQEREKRSAHSPDYKGRLDNIVCDHCGESFSRRVSAWIKTAQNGSRFLSLSFAAREDKPKPAESTEEDLEF